MRLSCWVIFLIVSLPPRHAHAQEPAPPPDSKPAADSDDSATIFPHPPTSRYWISGQVNAIFQTHGSFPAKYSGPNSFKADAENSFYRVLTLYTGLELGRHTEIFLDIESASGKGLSSGFGLAGFTNLDVVRSTALGAHPYVARVMLHEVIPLGGGTVEAERGPFQLAAELPVRRLEFRFGKFGLADFFDANAVGSDSHLQFMNWTVDNNGAWDFAADTRGYTYAAMVEYHDRRWGVRFAEALMPKVANGIDLDLNVARARAENVELELRGSLIGNRAGVIRLLGYVNHANMGSYREAIDAYLEGSDSIPDIEKHRQQGRIKYGIGINFQQQITGDMRVFGRWGWNEGQNESFAYTEVNQTVAFGTDYSGRRWKRKHDQIGVAMVTNAISGDHRRYLALGGKGFELGDGGLTYGREKIIEGYYNAHLWRGLFAAAGFQHIWNPGYNQDRGPVFVPSLRLHVDF